MCTEKTSLDHRTLAKTAESMSVRCNGRTLRWKWRWLWWWWRPSRPKRCVTALHAFAIGRRRRETKGEGAFRYLLV